MRSLLSLTLGAAMAAGLCPLAVCQNQPHLEALLAELGDADAARAAIADLEALAAQDPGSRQYIANRLPSLISTAMRGDLQLWISSLQLADDLRVVEVVPLLTELLRKDNKGIPIDFVASARLYDDPVAKTLSDIGEPATQSVAKLFDDGDAPTRRRAAIVLGNIATPRARKALVGRIQIEQVDDLRAVMQDQVSHIDKRAH